MAGRETASSNFRLCSFLSIWVLCCAEGHQTSTLSSRKRPDPDDVLAMARWLVSQNSWGVLSTISDHLGGYPFGNVASFSDGPEGHSTGTPYFYLTKLDPTAFDLERDSRCSFFLSEATIGTCGNTDAENPTCARVTLSGKIVELATEDHEAEFAALALFSKHPDMKRWPPGHHFHFYKLIIQDIFLIDYFGGAKPISVDDYYKQADNVGLQSTI